MKNYTYDKTLYTQRFVYMKCGTECHYTNAALFESEAEAEDAASWQWNFLKDDDDIFIDYSIVSFHLLKSV